jgi:xanthine dehydrogenase molybdopterin-binding subunit B
MQKIILKLGFGGKFSRANLTACAAAVASKSVNKTVRVALGMNTQYELIGKRDPWYAKYKVGFDNNGKINGLIINWYADAGSNQIDNLLIVGSGFVDNCYNIQNWKIVSKICKTNLAANTFFRAPGI